MTGVNSCRTGPNLPPNVRSELLYTLRVLGAPIEGTYSCDPRTQQH